jgi:hypothetical protein
MISIIQQITLELQSHQSQDAPSEIFGHAPRGDIREVQKKGGSPIIAPRPIRKCLRVQALFPHARSEPAI